MHAFRILPAAALILILMLTGIDALARPQEAQSSPIGVAVWIRDLVLPGSELEVRPAHKDTPIVARIAAVSPHGDAFRYDIVYYGLEPGHYDLRDNLRRVDGSSTEDLPPLPAQLHSMLPPGQVKPSPLRGGDLPRVGGYRTLLILGGVVWLAVLIAMLLAGHKQRRASVMTSQRGPPTLAERLQPLVEAARSGKISRAQRAELELMLITYWRRRLGLEECDAAEALTRMRAHEVAGPLLRQLEEWLHRPDPPREVNVSDLLEPYRRVEAEAEAGAGAARGSEMTTAGG